MSLGAAALADGEPPAEPAALIEDEITVSARAADAETASVTVVPSDEIEDAEVRNAAELVRLFSGVNVVSQGTLGGTSHAYTRGGDANFTLVLLDGIPLNDASDRQGGAVNLSTLAVHDLDRVEILRGPYSHFLGSSAVAGALNLVTRGGDEKRGDIDIDAGESSYQRGTLSVGAPTPGVRYFAAVESEQEEQAVADDRYEQLSLRTKLAFDLGQGAELKLVARYSDLETDDYPEASGGPVYGSGEVRLTETDQLTAGISLALVGESWQHAGSLSSNRADTDQATPGIGFVVPPAVESRSYRRSQLAWLSRRDLSGVGIALGFQVDREDGDNSSLLLLPPAFGGNVSGDYSLDRTTPGIFGEGTFRAGDLVVEAGVRADDPEDLDVEWSPRLGLRYGIGDSGWSLRSSWSRAFKLPSYFALASPPALGGNPDLLPETSEGIDLGVERRGGPHSLSLVLFSNTYEDLIDFDFDLFTHVNRSEVEAEGIELSTAYSPTTKLRLSSDWTWQQVEDTAPGSPPVLSSPDWFGNLRIAWHALDVLYVHLEARFSDESFDSQIPVPQRDRVDGYEVLDVAVRWQVTDEWRIAGHVDNVTDERYEQFIGFPHPGRRARVAVGYRFR
jgi:outer membrane cobalamin receptor